MHLYIFVDSPQRKHALAAKLLWYSKFFNRPMKTSYSQHQKTERVHCAVGITWYMLPYRVPFYRIDSSDQKGEGTIWCCAVRLFHTKCSQHHFECDLGTYV